MTEENSKAQKKIDVKQALMNLLNSSTTDGSQYVTFLIGKEEYGIEIKSVQEITAWKELTALPNTPTYVKGILNLRGNIIPIMDPRVRFNMNQVEYCKSSVIIIFDNNSKTSGIIVDKINDVLTIEKKDIDPTPEMATTIDTFFINGVGRVNEKFIILLDVNKLFSGTEEQIKTENKVPN